MITKSNYNSRIGEVGIDTLPEVLQEQHRYFIEAQDFYHEDEVVRETIDLYLRRLNEYLEFRQENKNSIVRDLYGQLSPNELAHLKLGSLSKAKEKLAAKLGVSISDLLAFDQRMRPVKGTATTKKAKIQRDTEPHAKQVENLSEEIKHLKRFIGFHDKLKPLSSVLSFIKSLQRAIVQKAIRKSSPLADDIRSIQDKMVKLYNMQKQDGNVQIRLSDPNLAKYVGIVGGERVYKSIGIIKRFIGMQGKETTKSKMEAFVRYAQNAGITEEDPYSQRVQQILESLSKPKQGKVAVLQQELNGLLGMINKCGSLGRIYNTDDKEVRMCKSRKYSDARRGACSHHKGLKQTQCKEIGQLNSISGKKPKNYPRYLGRIYDTSNRELRMCNSRKYSDAGKGACSHHKGLKKVKCLELNGIMTAEQVAKLEYEKLPFTGKWKDLVGQPSTTFDMMVFGQPGSGKTTFLLSFAHYLASNFGNVLYVSGEEFNSAPLTDKINQLPSLPPNLHFAEDIKNISLKDYRFVILDSITDLKIDLESYKSLRAMNPETAFILILQTTKDGQFKGGKDWEHEMEIGAEIDNGTISVFKNRYGIKGSFDFFR